MSGWSDPQKGGRAVGAALYPTLSSLLSTAPQPGMRATASDAPGSMLYEVGGKWGGDLGLVASDAALTALPTTSMRLVCACLANPLTPLGRTRMCLASGIWMPEPGQVLYGAKGSLLNMTAEALSIGAWNEVWQSAILPDWMFRGDPDLSLTAEAEIADASNTAAEKLRMTIRSSSSSAADENTAILGHSSAGVSAGRGLGGVRVRASVNGSAIIGNVGSLAYSASTTPRRTVGNWAPEATRIRLDATPGATTNTIKLFSVALWAGG